MQMKRSFLFFFSFATWLSRCIVVLIHGKVVNGGFIGKRNAPEPNQYIMKTADVHTNSYSYDYKLTCLSGLFGLIIF